MGSIAQVIFTFLGFVIFNGALFRVEKENFKPFLLVFLALFSLVGAFFNSYLRHFQKKIPVLFAGHTF